MRFFKELWRYLKATFLGVNSTSDSPKGHTSETEKKSVSEETGTTVESYTISSEDKNNGIVGGHASRP